MLRFFKIENYEIFIDFILNKNSSASYLFNILYKVMKEIIAYMKEKYNYDFPIDREHIIGHNEVNPIVRTKCPGNKFSFDQIIRTLK